MATIDDRVVEMTFKGTSFISGATRVLQALAQLKSSLNGLKGAGHDLDGLNEAGKNVQLGHISSALDSIKSKFHAMSIVGITALATVASSAVTAGLHMVKALTIDPIKAGLDVYETKINAIKTILANTQAEGTNLKQVTAALNQLNVYANKTVYNFGQMAKNIGTFTAAGVNLKDSVASIKGIANLAALSGSTSEQASTAMYQLSQAIAAGTVKLQDWNSVVNAGMGGKVFQTALINTARAMGVHIDSILQKAGSFRNSLQQGWLSAKILTNTLAQFTGDLSAAQLKAMGFTDKETAAIMRQAKAAVSSATQIRTISQLHQALAEEIATAWSHVWEAVFGNVNEATKTLSGVHSVLENLFTSPINNFAKMLEDFRHLGGFDLIIQGISTAFHNLASILHVIGEAFRSVFPSSGGGPAQGLIKIAIAFNNFMDALTPSAHTLENLKTIFTGLFSAVKIVIDVIKGVATAIFGIGSSAKGASGGLLDFVAKIAQFITNVKNAIERGTAFTTFFRVLGTVLSIPVKILGFIIGLLNDLGGAIGKALAALQPFVAKIEDFFSHIGDAAAKGISSGGVSQVLSVLNKVLFAGILLAIKKFISGLGDKLKLPSGGGFLGQIKAVFESLQGALVSLQRAINSTTLRNIAIAVGILAAAMLALSLISAPNLAKALTAMTVGLTQLMAGMAVLGKISVGGIGSMAAIAVAMNLVASAMLILTASVAILAHVSWEGIAKGLITTTGLMIVMVKAIQGLGKAAPQAIAGAFAMDLMAVALIGMATAIRILAGLDWQSLGKGVGTITALLAIMALFNRFGGTTLAATAAGLLLVSIALNAMAVAVKVLGSMSIAEIGKGLLGVAGGLIAIALGMSLMPPTMLLTAAGLLVVSAALTVLAGALKIMGTMSWSDIAKSLVELAGSLVILAAGLALMTGALPGAAALVVVAGGLAILVPVLIALGNIGWSTLLTALGGLAAIFLVLGAAGLLLAPLVPAILGLGAALVVLGVGVVAIGGGIALLGIGLTAIAAAISASGGAIVGFVKNILSLIPFALAKVGKGIAAFAGAIARSGTAIIRAFVQISTAVLNGIIKIIPKAATAFQRILTAILNIINRNAGPVARTMAHLLNVALTTIASNIGRFVQKGSDIIVGFLRGIARNAGRIVAAGTSAVVSFINGVSNNIGRVVNAGINLIIHFVNSLANSIRSHTGELRSAGFNLAGAIVDGLTGGLFSLAGRAISAAASLGSRIISALGRAVKFFSPSHEAWKIGESVAQGLALGLTQNAKLADTAGKKAGESVLKNLQDSLSNIDTSIGDLNPTITPVLDLSNAQKGFDDLAAMAANIAPVVSTAAAFASVPNITAAQAAQLQTGASFTFNQTNTSPKALDAATIYRQTHNLIAKTKGALPV
jgi:tape measure domain-containing protein